ncbi:lipase family protein [Actinokineospora spheciospongiae]|uniref:lipase family protein n=1 Tax=Actinokineospora spheciospongiae TaxID=909613 RepID=UPI000D70C180|nr:lipase family protein [Actinokineospora spheciospongiae]PWW63320.1 secretory lipase [Actinokineospora spheciospongiae]
MVRRSALVSSLVALALFTSGPAPVAGAAEPLPVPSQDAFYTPPAPLPAGSPGDVLRSRRVDWHPEPFRVLPAPVDAHQVLHLSTSATGARIAVSATVLVPPDAWPGPGPRPVVAYAMGTQGLGDQCAPSYHLRAGTEVEIAFLAQALLKGWAVVVTDYEGLGTPGTHTYAVGRSEGHALLDAARAATRLPEAGLDRYAPIGAFGYSQGGQAAAWAGELQPTYAPELNLVGIAEGGVPSDLNEVAAFNDGNLGSGLLVAAAVGYAAAYPELPFADQLTRRGKDLTAKVRDACVAELALAAPFTRLNDLTTTPDLIDSPAWQARLAENRLGTTAPTAPVYLYHGTLDELIPYAAAEALRDRYCARGADIQWTPIPLAGHITAVSVWGTAALNWLGDRYAGKPTRPSC